MVSCGPILYRGRDVHRKFLQSQGCRPLCIVGCQYVDVASGRQAALDEACDTASAELIRLLDPIERCKPGARTLIVIPSLEHPADDQRPCCPGEHRPFGHLSIDRRHARMDSEAMHCAT